MFFILNIIKISIVRYSTFRILIYLNLFVMIKNLLFAIAAMSIMLLVSCSQDMLKPADEVISQTVPDAVKQSFKSTFPEATETNWIVAGDLYLVNFMNNDLRSGATYKKPNNLSLDWYLMDKDLLPQDIKDYMVKNYDKATIKKNKRITYYDDNSKGAIRFELTIDFKDRIVFLEFKPDGTLLSSKTEDGNETCDD